MQLFQRVGMERRRDRKNLENFHYEAIYDSLNAPMNTQQATTLMYLKAKITRLLHYGQQRMFLDNEGDVMMENRLSITTLEQKQDARIVSDIQDSTGVTQTTMNILRTFTESSRKKYDAIPVDESIRVIMTNKTLPREVNLVLNAPITKDELQQAVKKGKPKKAPGSDGMHKDLSSHGTHGTRNTIVTKCTRK
jgi:hypothetical protein